MENNNETWFVSPPTYLEILAGDGEEWAVSNRSAESACHHFSGSIKYVMDDVALMGDEEEDIDYGDDEPNDSLDGDHESALESVYGPDNDAQDDGYFDEGIGCYDE